MMQYLSMLWKSEMRLFFYIIFAVMCFLVPESQANQSLTNSLRQAEQGNITSALASRAQFQGRDRDTLDWYIYSKGDAGISFEEVATFLQRNKNWPYSITLQKKAEENLGGVLSAQAFDFFSAKSPVTAKAMNLYIQALKAKNQHAKAKQVLSKWWPNASLSRDEQRDFYSAFSRMINRDVHISRLHALLDKREYSNASAMAQTLGDGYPKLAAARQALGQNSASVNAKIANVSQSLSGDVGLMFDRLQWRRKKDLNQGAIEILNAAPPASKMRHPEKWWRERHIITRRLMEARQYNAAYRLASTHKQQAGFPELQAEWLSGFLALRLVYQQGNQQGKQPFKAFEHFEKLYKTAISPISKARGAYWAGRASADLNSLEIANKWYAAATKYPETFYGQLAGEKLGKRLSFNMREANQNIGPLNSPLVEVAKNLSNAGLKKETGAFLTRAMEQQSKSPQALEALAQAATQMGQKNIAIKIAQNLQKKHGIVLGGYLYPQKTQELQNVRGVEWALINAIIRQESRFDQTAKSHAGARGLMQLMPATARETAARMGMQHQTAWLTSRPSHNITLGSKYLEQMVARYNGNYAMAAAAYNAGPGRVDRWIKEIGDPRTGQIDFLDWAEQIPIYETRNYVQRVLEAVYVYRTRLKGRQPNVSGPIHVALAQ